MVTVDADWVTVILVMVSDDDDTVMVMMTGDNDDEDNRKNYLLKFAPLAISTLLPSKNPLREVICKGVFFLLFS